MNVLAFSERCIKKYLAKYNIRLKIYEDFSSEQDDKGKMTISTKDDTDFGLIIYEFEGRDLFINEIRISKDKHRVSVKLLQVFLIYLLARYSHRTDYIKLVANPAYDNTDRGIKRGYCLPCYYQKLGFDPIQNDVDRLMEMIEFCKKELNYVGNNYPMCILCDCQTKIDPSAIELKGFRVTALDVRMEKLLPNLKHALINAYQTIQDELKE